MYGWKCDETMIMCTTEIVFVVEYEHKVALLLEAV
jgi:hypothetical protein